MKVQVWSPLPPQESGIADYVFEQLEVLNAHLDLTIVVENASLVDGAIGSRYRVIAAAQADESALRVYHVGNSPLHAFVYREALRVPGVVFLHEWNLHELVLGFGVRSNDFTEYRAQMRRQHSEKGAVAAETMASALGGKHWPAVFELNAAILDEALAVVCLSTQTARRVSLRRPGLLLFRMDHHAVLEARAQTGSDARRLLGLPQNARIVLAPGLGTASKSLDVARAAIASLQKKVSDLLLVTVGGGGVDGLRPSFERSLGRVDLKTLGDALIAADVVIALRFPSRGETSGVLMRAFAAGRAAVVSSGSAADEDLPSGVVARVNPGPSETAELSAVLSFLLSNDDARHRLERLALSIAANRTVGPATEGLLPFLDQVARARAGIEARIREGQALPDDISPLIRNSIDGALSSLGLGGVPKSVYAKLSSLGLR